MKRMRVIIGLLVALTTVAIAFGGSASAATKAAKPAKGGTLTILKAGEAALGWDPINVGAIPQNTPTPQQFLIFDLLVYEDPVTLQITPRIAQSFTSTDNGTTWTLKLRP